jgi:hypothetical protein
MKKMTGFLAVLIMLMWTNTIRADANSLVNGSFEDPPGWIDDINAVEPNGWDVNMPTEKFTGWVHADWVTDGLLNLMVYSFWHQAFDANDRTTVSQYVNLTDVNSIVLDLKLSTYPANRKWDPNKRTAGVLIDDVLIWEAYKSGDDLRGEYRNQFIPVDFGDRGLHKLSLALIADVNETPNEADRYYYTFWDNIRFNLHCGGNGFTKGDFNKDCRVDMNDYCMLADKWLEEVEPNSIYNLSNEGDVVGYGVIDFKDFVIFANGWEIGTFEQLEEFTDLWLISVPYDNEWNLYKGDDAAAYGIVNYADLAVFVQDWLGSSLP